MAGKAAVPRPAMDYLFQFVVEEETGLVTARNLVAEFIRKTEQAHEPLTGEAYPEDRNRYCAVCMSSDGGSARHPCQTIRRMRKLLGSADQHTGEPTCG